MKYMGSKNSFAKHIIPIIKSVALSDIFKQSIAGGPIKYVEPFVGGANMIDKVNADGFADELIGNDNNYYLIKCLKALEEGWWIPPKNITREQYKKMKLDIKNNVKENAHINGYIAINASYGGKMGGGYSGISTTNTGKIRNYIEEAYKNVFENQAPLLKGINFICSDYSDLDIKNSIVYCDPPYENTTGYTTSGSLNHKHLWEWYKKLETMGNVVFISEYQAPDGYICVWEKETKSSMRVNKDGIGAKKHTEKLFVTENTFNKYFKQNQQHK